MRWTRKRCFVNSICTCILVFSLFITLLSVLLYTILPVVWAINNSTASLPEDIPTSLSREGFSCERFDNITCTVTSSDPSAIVYYYAGPCNSLKLVRRNLRPKNLTLWPLTSQRIALNYFTGLVPVVTYGKSTISYTIQATYPERYRHTKSPCPLQLFLYQNETMYKDYLNYQQDTGYLRTSGCLLVNNREIPIQFNLTSPSDYYVGLSIDANIKLNVTITMNLTVYSVDDLVKLCTAHDKQSCQISLANVSLSHLCESSKVCILCLSKESVDINFTATGKHNILFIGISIGSFLVAIFSVILVIMSCISKKHLNQEHQQLLQEPTK